MLRADNTAYDYSRYEQLEMEQVREIAASPRKKVHKKEKHKTHLMSILFVFGLSIFIISRYAYMAEINYNIKDYSILRMYKTCMYVQRLIIKYQRVLKYQVSKQLEKVDLSL